MLHEENPALLITAHFAHIQDRMSPTIPPGNPRLQIALIDVVRCQGDWLAALVLPWSIRLLLLNGGGRLWGEIPDGQRRYIDLPGVTLPFVAESDAEIGAWQYASLVDDLEQVADMASARQLAQDGLQLALGQVSAVPAPAQAVTPGAPVSRRGFFRRLAGKRD